MKNNENGRSMIEMLGVLAIIGVLSVGGIAGYSKAMMKYRTNKTLEQISMIVTNVRTLFGSQKTYEALGDTTKGDLIAKARLFPDELLNGTAGLNANPNPFGGDIHLIYSDRAVSGDKKAFLLSYGSIPEEACMDLITQDWGSASGSGLIVAGVVKTSSGSTPAFAKGQWQDKYQSVKSTATNDGFVGGGQGPMTASEAATVCDGDNNRLYLKFY